MVLWIDFRQTKLFHGKNEGRYKQLEVRSPLSWFLSNYCLSKWEGRMIVWINTATSSNVREDGFILACGPRVSFSTLTEAWPAGVQGSLLNCTLVQETERDGCCCGLASFSFPFVWNPVHWMLLPTFRCIPSLSAKPFRRHSHSNTSSVF